MKVVEINMNTKEDSKHRLRFDYLSNKIDLISAGLLVILVFVVLIEVVARYFFNSPFTFTYDLTSLLFPWIVFLSLISVTYHKEHIGIVLFINKLPERLRNGVFIFNEFLTLFFILFMFIGAVRLSIAVSNQMIGNLYMSKTFYYLSLDIALAVILYLKINEIIAILKRRKILPLSYLDTNQTQEIQKENSIHSKKEGEDN